MSKVEFEETLKCSECAAPIRPNQERCDYCGYWLKQPEPINEIPETEEVEYSYSPSLHKTAVEIMIAFILAMVGIVVGINFIQPVFICCKLCNRPISFFSNLNISRQITWLFILLMLLGVILFLGMLGKNLESKV